MFYLKTRLFISLGNVEQCNSLSSPSILLKNKELLLKTAICYSQESKYQKANRNVRWQTNITEGSPVLPPGPGVQGGNFPAKIHLVGFTGGWLTRILPDKIQNMQSFKQQNLLEVNSFQFATFSTLTKKSMHSMIIL